MTEIGIFVGTVYGNALSVAETSKIILVSLGHKVIVYDNPEFSDWKKYENNYVLIVTSSTGKGNLPDNIFPLFKEINDKRHYHPRLGYGLIALGDSSYINFCGGGKKFDALLQKKGEKRVGHVLCIDAKKHLNPENMLKSWVRDWAILLEQ